MGFIRLQLKLLILLRIVYGVALILFYTALKGLCGDDVYTISSMLLFAFVLLRHSLFIQQCDNRVSVLRCEDRFCAYCRIHKHVFSG